MYACCAVSPKLALDAAATDLWHCVLTATGPTRSASALQYARLLILLRVILDGNCIKLAVTMFSSSNATVSDQTEVLRATRLLQCRWLGYEMLIYSLEYTPAWVGLTVCSVYNSVQLASQSGFV